MKALGNQAQKDRILCQRSLYYLCKEVLGYKDMVPHIHGDLAHFATDPRYGRFRQACVPRSHFKTWLWTVGKSIWLTLPDEEALFTAVFPYKGPDTRILIASNVIDNAAKMVNKIKTEWENNDRLKAAFPEIVPEYNKTRWSDHCAEVRRKIIATEGTYTAVGVGGSVISQHFDHIQEDDLIYAKKDDFSGQELMPSQEDIENAIGWHKLTFSLLADPQKGTMDNVGTRWAPHDLIDYIRKTERKYWCFEITATKDGMWPVPDNSYCAWPERYDKVTLEDIRDSQGPKIFETQYLNRPRAGEDVTFDIAYLKQHDSIDEFPPNLRYTTIVDLASWSDKKRICNNVVMTGAKDEQNDVWIGRIDVGKFTPTEVIDIIKVHQTQFNSKVLIEEVGYQVALRHFAKKEMQSANGRHYIIESLPRDNRKGAKDLRIESVEPIVSNGALHTIYSMASLRREMEDYPYSSTKDILDVLGFMCKYAKKPRAVVLDTYEDPFSLEAIEKELKANKVCANDSLPFSVQLEAINAWH